MELSPRMETVAVSIYSLSFYFANLESVDNIFGARPAPALPFVSTLHSHMLFYHNSVSSTVLTSGWACPSLGLLHNCPALLFQESARCLHKEHLLNSLHWRPWGLVFLSLGKLKQSEKQFLAGYKPQHIV